MNLLGESQAELARTFDLSEGRVRQLILREEQSRRSRGDPWGERWLRGMAKAAWLDGLEPVE